MAMKEVSKRYILAILSTLIILNVSLEKGQYSKNLIFGKYKKTVYFAWNIIFFRLNVNFKAKFQ